MYIILIGPQGCGKGTQGQLIKMHHKFRYISTGVLLRRRAKYQNDVARLTKEGSLISDEIINNIVDEDLKENSHKNIIFDGYPRTIKQAEHLLRQINANKQNVVVVIYLKLDDIEAVKRISKRLTCSGCGFVVYPNKFSLWKLFKICPNCHNKLSIRADDNEVAVKERLKLFHTETEPLIVYFKNKNILYTIEGKDTVKNIFNQIEKIINENKK